MNKEIASTNTKHMRKIEVVAEATTVDGWKKRVVAGQRGEKQFDFLSDEARTCQAAREPPPPLLLISSQG